MSGRVHEANCPFQGRVMDPAHTCWTTDPPDQAATTDRNARAGIENGESV